MVSKILLVDDAIVNCRVLAVLLTRAGYHVITAGGVEEAVEKFDTERPDAVLTDMRMPSEGDGLRLAKILRSRSEGRDIRIALMTGDSSSVDDTEHLFDAILDKPVLLADFQKFMEGVM